MVHTKGKYIKFADVVREYPILDVAQLLNLHLWEEQGGKNRRGPCPKCSDKRSFTLTPADGYCMCHKCGAIPEGTDCIGLVKIVKGCKDMNEAAWLIHRALGGHEEATVPEAKTEEGTTPQGVQPLTPLSNLDFEHENVAKLGFPLDVARVLGIGYQKKGTIARGVGIPLRDENGWLVAYFAPVLEDDGSVSFKLPTRWHIPPDKKPPAPKPAPEEATNVVRFAKKRAS